jgi:hypothetical protein
MTEDEYYGLFNKFPKIYKDIRKQINEIAFAPEEDGSFFEGKYTYGFHTSPDKITKLRQGLVKGGDENEEDYGDDDETSDTGSAEDTPATGEVINTDNTPKENNTVTKDELEDLYDAIMSQMEGNAREAEKENKTKTFVFVGEKADMKENGGFWDDSKWTPSKEFSGKLEKFVTLKFGSETKYFRIVRKPRTEVDKLFKFMTIYTEENVGSMEAGKKFVEDRVKRISELSKNIGIEVTEVDKDGNPILDKDGNPNVEKLELSSDKLVEMPYGALLESRPPKNTKLSGKGGVTASNKPLKKGLSQIKGYALPVYWWGVWKTEMYRRGQRPKDSTPFGEIAGKAFFDTQYRWIVASFWIEYYVYDTEKVYGNYRAGDHTVRVAKRGTFGNYGDWEG